MTPEGRIKRSILEYLKSKDIFAWNNQTVGIRGRSNHGIFSANGSSDILGIMGGGSFLAIEVKTKKGKVSEKQQAFLDKINHAGGRAGVATCIDDVEEILMSARYIST